MPSAERHSWGQDGYRLSQKDVEAYLDDLASRNATENTVANYRRSLSMFSEWLPEDRLVNEARVNDYQKNLLAKYTPRTVNMKLTAVNGLLRYLGLRQYQSTANVKVDPIEIRPELTRNEYLRMLSAAKQNEDKRLYLLIKLFATTGITVQEVDNVTVEAVQEGKVVTYPGRVRHEVRIPPCVQEELLDYIHELGYRSGPIFLTRDGHPLERTTIATMIKRLSRYSGLPAEKCTARCLRQLYTETQENIKANVAVMLQMTYDRLLEQEQITYGWKDIPRRS